MVFATYEGHSQSPSKQHSFKIFAKILSCCIIFLHVPCFAQRALTQATLQKEQQYWRTQQEAIERQRQLDEPDVHLPTTLINKSDLASQKAPSTPLLPNETPCYRIEQFVFELPPDLPKTVQAQSGTTSSRDTFYFLNQAIAFAQGQCLGREGIQILVKQLLHELIRRGYATTRIGLANQQDISTGILRFTLLPGFIQQFRFQGPFPLRLNTFPNHPGDLLNTRDLEQGLEQMERMSGSKVSMQIVPGEQIGSSDIVLSLVQTKPWHFSINLDDSGSPSTGYLQTSLRLNLDNPLGINDTLMLTANHSADGKIDQHGIRGMGLYYTIPWGNWTLSMNANQSQQYFRRPNAKRWPFTTTETQQLDGKIAYMFFRDQVQKNSIEFRVHRYWSDTSLANAHWTMNSSQNHPTTPNGIWLISQHRNNTYADLSYIHRHHFGAAKLDLMITYRWGTPWFGAEKQGNAFAQHYNLKIIDSTLNIPFSLAQKTAYYTSTLRTQITNSPLDNNQMFGIGNRWTVRGFDAQSSLAAEQGFFWRNEIQMPTLPQQAIYYGMDMGTVWQINASPNRQKTLAGITVGIRGNLSKQIAYDIFGAAPLYQPGNIRSAPALGFNVKWDL